ncbi:CDP-diacylglycerol--serine O-phosphatidyltransferase [Ottowia sp. oral taxon 894]|uniref:CDP-diacylglycerol--serine O-phosphatidyltransferase n=1 Tax=Ottowia sp. oral taxon 894 TaxID=1658672 RepID=UPI0009E3153C|nr:CDP-diacylglycerol--serine O-phosphatidyltransferase [Ottowia sp. oral taxon 894]
MQDSQTPENHPRSPAPFPASPPAPAAPAGVRRLRKGIYIVPNSITLAALFCGFYAIVMAINGRFDYATTSIFAAMILDGMDGRAARMMHAQSAFGEQMDSLCDMVSFGVAPALVAYEWALRPLGRWGWIAAFVYCACAALRLARFNVNTAVVDKRYFQGLPSPAAAALVGGFIWLTSAMLLAHKDVPIFRSLFTLLGGAPLERGDLSWTLFGITLLAGLTMVTNIPYYSFKDLGGRRSMPFVMLVLVALLLAVISIEPATMLFLLFVGYALSGYLIYAWRKATGQHASIVSTSTEEPDEQGLHR